MAAEAGIGLGLPRVAAKGERAEIAERSEEYEEHGPDTSGSDTMLTDTARRARRECGWKPIYGI